MKTWFIGCKTCLAEFPELSEMVENQHQNENLLFISLANDEAEPLKKSSSKAVCIRSNSKSKSCYGAA